MKRLPFKVLHVVTLVARHYYCCCVECAVEAHEVQGKCHVVFGEEIDDLDSYFLEKLDVFWFSEVTIIVVHVCRKFYYAYLLLQRHTIQHRKK